jgi:predicted DNA binding CopG/RHH family protein
MEIERIPTGVPEGYEETLAAKGYNKTEIKRMVKKARQNGEDARRKAEKEQRIVDVLQPFTEQEKRDSAMLSIDHTQGILLVSATLQDVLDAHIRAIPTGRIPTRSGKINTMLDYILAHIHLLHGVKLSKKPLQDLRAIHTEDDANACGISHKNICLIWTCLLSIKKSGARIPIGNENQIAALAETMSRDAHAQEKEARAAANITPTLKKAPKRIRKEARSAFFADNPNINKHQSLGLHYREVEENRFSGAVDHAAKDDDSGSRTADHGAEMSEEDRETEKLRLENKRLIEKLLAQK